MQTLLGRANNNALPVLKLSLRCIEHSLHWNAHCCSPLQAAAQQFVQLGVLTHLCTLSLL